MDAVFLIAIGAVLWAHSWYMLGLYQSLRTVGIIAAAVAIILLGLVVFQNIPSLITADEQFKDLGLTVPIAAPLSGFILIWAIYAAILAAVGLWGFDERTLGFYGLFLAVVTLLVAVYFFRGEGATISAIWALAAILLTVLAALLFFWLAPPYPRMRIATGWVFLVFSIILAALGAISFIAPLDLVV